MAGQRDRLAGREMAQRSLRRLGVAAQRSSDVVAALEMQRQLGCGDGLASLAPTQQRKRHLAMPLRAPRRADALVEDLAHQRVAEGIALVGRAVVAMRGEPLLTAHELVALLGDGDRVAPEDL